ncbi:hypothetical protein BHE90_001073 [Fusarium euwallaceae]|uniref:Heterokaryon incompatibility domain-containing protein n=1 Tax=Fusarium euwallaceae TaxID=1147111 RepID=A0A430M912_9HYPO|nr:hypothetical protein BHE90_001073 [Fusarium euwallaceae]
MSELPEPFNTISNTAKKQGWTPLACASDAGNVDKVAELLDSMHVDIDIDGRDYDGRTPIALAARNGHTDIVARLLAHGADPNLRDLQQMAPLWHAARHGHAPVVRALLESGRLSDVNPRPLNPFWYQSETPLAIALKYDHRETAELLARADGIDPFVEVGPDREPYSTCSVLALAIRGGHEDVALILLENRDLEPRSPYVYVASSNKSCDSLGARSSNNDSVDAGSINNMREDTDDTGSNNSDSEDAASRIKDDSDYVGSINNMDRNSDATRSINSDSDDEAFSNSNDSDSVRSSNCPRNDSLRAESIDNSIDDARSEYNYSGNSDSGTSSSYLPKRTVQLASKLLVFAAGAGCYRVVQELLANHDADVNALHIYRDERKFTQGGGGVVGCTEESPLFAASRRGHSSIVRLLLDTERIQPDLRCSCVGSYGDTALALAAEGGFVDIVRMLAADTRVEIDHKDQRGRTPLSYAAEYGHEAVVAWLLETEAVDPDSQCSSGYTPLMRAVRPDQSYITIQWEAQEGVVRRLLASGHVNPNCTNNNGKSAMSFMAECPSIRPITALLKHLGTDLDRGRWSLLLRSAAESGGADTVQMLLDAPPVGTDATKPSLEDHMNSALQFAASFGNESVVQVLLSRPGINPNSIGKSGETPLLMATRHDGVGVVKQLSNVVGIDPNTQDDEGWTALCCASYDVFREESTEIMRVLLKIPGINPNLANNLGRTALSLATEAGSVERVDILLAVDGIDPDARDSSGSSPLSWALKSHGFKKGDITLQKTNDRKQVVRRLIALPAVDINAEDAEGLTPLLRAIKIDFSDEFVGILLTRADLDVNRRGRDGVSPLTLAKGAGNTVTIALLQEHGAIASDGAALSDEPVVPVVDSDSSYSGSGFPMDYASSSDSMLDESFRLEEGLRLKLRENLAREYRLPLGTQQEYVGRQAAETVDKVCSTCAAIDLDAAFSNRHTKYGGRIIADLGRVDKTWEERNCSFCRLFAAVRPLPGINGGHKLVSLSTTQSWLCHDQLGCWGRIKGPWVDTMVLAVVAGPVPEEKVGDDFEDRQDIYVLPNSNSVGLKVVKRALSAGLIGRLGSNCPKNKNAVTITRLTPYGSDSTMSMAKSWIKRCRQSHFTRCNPRKLSPVPHFRLIECTSRRIIRIEESATAEPPKDVALSYVWGQPPPGQPQPHQPQGNPVEKVSATVEAVTEDAIRVALALGYEYLWVDRYCVMQTGNEAIKMEQLRHMHTVYANAEVTLVAAAGKDPSSGLPGAPGDSRRFQQPSAVVSGHALVCIPPDPTHHIRSASTWATRGWTFQEGLFARRRLFFSDYEISYYHQLSTADDSSKDLWSGQRHILEITACAATVRFRRTTETVDDSGGWIGTVCAGDRVWQGEFSLTRRDHDDGSDGDTACSLHSALLEKPWSGIVLSNSCVE